MDRPLYLLVHDEQVQAADPEDKLYISLTRSWDCRTIAHAKALSAEGEALLLKVLCLNACLKQLLIASYSLSQLLSCQVSEILYSVHVTFTVVMLSCWYVGESLHQPAL
jgi:hypothetical protein